MTTATPAVKTARKASGKRYRKVRVFQLSINQIAFLMLASFIIGLYVR